MQNCESGQIKHSQMKSQLRNFINLLQSGNQNLYKSLKSSKLSIILSASQPSSSVDKQNSNMSANRSPVHSAFQTSQKAQISNLVKQLQKTGLSKPQQLILTSLNFQIDQLIKSKSIIEQKIQIYQEQLNREKKGTDQLMEALMKMDQQQKELWNTYYQLSDKFNAKSVQLDNLRLQNANLQIQNNSLQLLNDNLKLQNGNIQIQNGNLKQQNQQIRKDIIFMKKLVYLANQNYQSLQAKYQQVHQNNSNASKRALRPLQIQQKRSAQNLLQRNRQCDVNATSRQKNKRINRYSLSPNVNDIQNNRKYLNINQMPNSHSPASNNQKSIKSKRSASPLIKEKQNMETNFKDFYRKIIMKTLNTKINI